jgi:hypothetical protein
MYMKVFPRGQGNGDQPTRYLVRPDYPGRREAPPEILRGDPDVTRDLIDSIDRKWKFTAGVLSWHPDDTVTPEQEERVMDDFESVAFAGLEINRAGKDYLTVKDPESGEKLRLKGGIYGEQWNFTEFTGRKAQGQDRAGCSGDREPDPATVRQLEQELGRILTKRAQYNRKRYPQQHVRLEK